MHNFFEAKSRKLEAEIGGGVLRRGQQAACSGSGERCKLPAPPVGSAAKPQLQTHCGVF